MCYTFLTDPKNKEQKHMQIFLSVLAGLLWGGLCGLVNMLLTKKMASGSTQQISSLGIIRTAVDLVALAAVYFTRGLLPLRFEYTLIATAVALSLVGIISAFRLSASMKG